jgi:hypothetical protein
VDEVRADFVGERHHYEATLRTLDCVLRITVVIRQTSVRNG